MKQESKKRPSALYEHINLMPKYAENAVPLQVPIQFLAGRQVSADYTEKSMRDVRELYKKESEEILEILRLCPVALCALIEANAATFVILNGHTRARLLPTAPNIKALPSLVYSPEQVVEYLRQEQAQSQSVGEFIDTLKSQTNTAIAHFEMLMGDSYIAPQTVRGLRSLKDITTLEKNGISRFLYRSVARN